MAVPTSTQPVPDPTRSGYDPDFLAARVETPTAPGTPQTSPVLPYTHFTVCLNTNRRLAWWVAWNIDGLQLHPGEGALGRDGIAFHADPRVPAEQQALDDIYAGNRLDRGHIARRADLLWGTLAEAKAANLDSFSFPNITPQLDWFNQSGASDRLPAPPPGSAPESWGLLENAVLAFDGLEDRRISVLGGPVLAADDPTYRELQIPRDFWKIVIYSAGGQLRFKAFVLTQDISTLGARPLDYLAEFDTYQVDLADLEQRTGVSFADLTAAGATPEPTTVQTGARAPDGPVQVLDAADLTW